MRNSIRNRLTWAFIGLAIGPLLLLGIILVIQSFTTQREQAYNLQSVVAQRVSTQVTAFFTEIEDQLRIVSKTQGLQDLDGDKQRSILAELLSYQDVFENLALLDRRGQERVHLARSSVSPRLGNRAQADEFVIPQTTGQTYYSSIRFDETTGEPYMTIAVPLLNLRTGLVDGVLVSEARLKKIWELIASLRLSSGQSVYILDAQGKVVAHRNPSVVLRGVTFLPSNQDSIQPGLASVDPASAVATSGGGLIKTLVARLSSPSVVLATDTVQIGEQKITVVSEQTLAEALALAINTTAAIAGLTIIALVLSASAGLRTVRQIVQPIQSMAVVAQAISAGDLAQQVQVASQDELGVLGNAFNGMTTQLRQTLANLEQRVAERTQELQSNLQELNLSLKKNQERTAQLEAIADTARSIASLQSLDQLLAGITKLVSERFGFYHVGIFLLDKDREFAVLSAANSLGGEKMLARKHKLRVGQEGLVGYAIEQKRARIALDVGDDAVFFSNPDLPDTHSEMALPLVIGNNSIGALDVQSDQPNAFSNEDMQVLATLANQIAVAIENARLFEQSRQSMQELEKTFKRYVRQEWGGFSEAAAIKGYTARHNELEPISITLSADGAAEKNESVYKVPVTLRGVTVGVLDIDLGKNPKEYSREELDIIRSTADRIALALENARLLQSSQNQAAKERVIGEISSKISAAASMENILKTAAGELGNTIPDTDIVIQFVTEEDLKE